eukprot:11176634-Lingulodinium_polyedra.AAC.1
MRVSTPTASMRAIARSARAAFGPAATRARCGITPRTVGEQRSDLTSMSPRPTGVSRTAFRRQPGSTRRLGGFAPPGQS